ncbi:MAG: hypothetical protein M3Y87_12905 [Myxococcota bacterium]|nr:hypothetical protein [Myxococcota bacterium]
MTKRGKPLARVIPSGVTATYPQDTLAGTVEILGDALAPAVAPGDWNAMRGVLLTQEDAPRARKSRRR